MTVRTPMKYVEIPVNEIEDYLSDPNWVFEQKVDGTRGLAVVTANKVFWPAGDGKRTLAHTAATQHFSKLNPVLIALFAKLVTTDAELVLDGEIMTGTGEYLLFDLPYLRIGGKVLVGPATPLSARRAALETLAAALPANSRVKLLRQTRTEADKRDLFEAVQISGGEGVIAKQVDALYEPGKRVKTVRKLKFVQTADVIITSVNRPDAQHGSAKLAVTTEFGMKPVGACSLIGKPNVKVGDVIEVAFLFFTDAGTLYQPRMLKIRDDKAAAECTLDQFRVYSRAMV